MTAEAPWLEVPDVPSHVVHSILIKDPSTLQRRMPCRVYTFQDPSRKSVHEPQHVLNVRPPRTRCMCTVQRHRLYADRHSVYLCNFPVSCGAMAETEKAVDVPVTKTPKETRNCSCNCVSLWDVLARVSQAVVFTSCLIYTCGM